MNALKLSNTLLKDSYIIDKKTYNKIISELEDLADMRAILHADRKNTIPLAKALILIEKHIKTLEK